VSYPRIIEWEDLSIKRQRRVIGRLVQQYGIKPHEAEDCVSEAVLRLMRMRPVVTHPAGLLKQTALNVFNSEQRRRHRSSDSIAREVPLELTVLTPAEETADERTDPAVEVEHRDSDRATNSRLRRAIAQLDDDDQSRVASYYFEQKGLLDLDRERGDHPGTAKTKLHRTRERLRRAWRDTGPQGGRSR